MDWKEMLKGQDSNAPSSINKVTRIDRKILKFSRRY